MHERTCLDCGVGLTKKPGPGRWPHRCHECRARKLTPEERSELARRAVLARHARGRTFDRVCEGCEAEFLAATPKARYCSQRCRGQASYLRKKATPEAWEQYLADCRKRYVPKGRPPGPAPKQVTCGVDGCDAKHLARGMCRKHYRAWQYEQDGDKRNPETVIGGMASLFGAYFPKPKPIKVRLTVGVMAYCPWCAATLAATSPTDRYCRGCGTTVVLNEEEVSWVISERRSTAA